MLRGDPPSSPPSATSVHQLAHTDKKHHSTSCSRSHPSLPHPASGPALTLISPRNSRSTNGTSRPHEMTTKCHTEETQGSQSQGARDPGEPRTLSPRAIGRIPLPAWCPQPSFRGTPPAEMQPGSSFCTAYRLTEGGPACPQSLCLLPMGPAHIGTPLSWLQMTLETIVSLWLLYPKHDGAWKGDREPKLALNSVTPHPPPLEYQKLEARDSLTFLFISSALSTGIHTDTFAQRKPSIIQPPSSSVQEGLVSIQSTLPPATC